MKYVRVEFKVPITSKVRDLKHIVERVEHALIGDEKVYDIKVSAGTEDLNDFAAKTQ